MENKNWSRRRFTKAVISAQALIASGVLALPLSCKEESKSESSRSSNTVGLTTAEQQTLELAMALVIPAQGKMPSAAEAGGLDYVLNILEELPDLRPLFLGLVEARGSLTTPTGTCMYMYIVTLVYNSATCDVNAHTYMTVCNVIRSEQ